MSSVTTCPSTVHSIETRLTLCGSYDRIGCAANVPVRPFVAGSRSALTFETRPTTPSSTARSKAASATTSSRRECTSRTANVGPLTRDDDPGADAARAEVQYQQPAGDIGALPYTPAVPASSSCATTASSQLYTDAASIAAAASSTSASIASVSSASVASVSSVSASISSVSYYSAHPIVTVTAAPTVVTQTQANAGSGKSSDARSTDASALLSILLAGGFAALIGVLTL